MNTLGKFIERHLALWAVLLSGVALVWPSGFTWMKPHIPLLLGAIMFGMGMTLEAADFKRVILQPKLLAVGILAQFGMMPMLGFLIAKVFGFGPELSAGIILLGACPGGTASNVITYLAKGNVGLSVSLTLCSTLLAPVMTPWLTWLYAHSVVDVNVMGLMGEVIRIVLIPLIVGLGIRTFAQKWVQPWLAYFPFISVTIILAVIACVVGLNAATIRGVSALVAIAVVLHNGSGLCLGYGIAALFTEDKAVRRTVAIEVGMQNSGLAVALALKTSGFGAMAALPGALFSVWHNIAGMVLASRWSKKQ